MFFLLWSFAVAGWRFISMYERKKARRKTEALEAQAKALEATVNERTEEIRSQAAEITAQKDSIELAQRNRQRDYRLARSRTPSSSSSTSA